MKVELVSYSQSPNHDKSPIDIIENAASNCYDSTVKTKGKIAKHCYNSGHLSVFEFAQFHFHVEGVSRALLAQLTRHRTGKFAVRSQRYCSEDNFEYITPNTIKERPNVQEEYDNLMNHINWFYKFAQQYDIPNEDARMVLPNACKTILDVSFDLRNLMHFMNERLCSKAQWEIREMAEKMRDCVLEVEPDLKPYLVPKCFVRGGCNEIKPCGKYSWKE